ncbi:MAG: NAD-dependent epimerase/dehydratase family protein [Candidatus Omnitrophica bacterium]|nr:NAD-dependent epimerase/dehydratase family protein [Candidatus Omnitrophota bacterium]
MHVTRYTIAMTRALVLGSTGHIGAHIIRALLADGHQVRAAYRRDRFLSVLDGLPVERVRVDLDTLDGLREALDGCEWVFHAAGYYPGFTERYQRSLAQAIESTRRVIERLRAARPARVVFTSSAATIRRVPGRLADERDAEPWPLASWRPLYATVKIAMERELLRARDAGLPVVVVNPSLCIGEYDARPFSGRALLLYAKHRLPVYVEHTFNVIYTGDVGVGHVRAAARGRLGERYLLTCRNISLKEFATLAAAAAGGPPPRLRLPYRAVWAAALASEGVAWLTRCEPVLPRAVAHAARVEQRLDGSKAVRELGLPQTPIEEAIARAVAWFRTQGSLCVARFLKCHDRVK